MTYLSSAALARRRLRPYKASAITQDVSSTPLTLGSLVNGVTVSYPRCRTCDIGFQTHCKLQEHESSQPQVRPREPQRNQHEMRSQEPPFPAKPTTSLKPSAELMTCHLCGREFANNANLQRHQKRKVKHSQLKIQLADYRRHVGSLL